jgi:hypothetical protein
VGSLASGLGGFAASQELLQRTDFSWCEVAPFTGPEMADRDRSHSNASKIAHGQADR